jgi:transposase-like protein
VNRVSYGPGNTAACGHERVSRVAPLYVDGRPLYKCDDCDARLVYEDDERSFKALAPLPAAGHR